MISGQSPESRHERRQRRQISVEAVEQLSHIAIQQTVESEQEKVPPETDTNDALEHEM